MDFAFLHISTRGESSKVTKRQRGSLFKRPGGRFSIRHWSIFVKLMVVIVVSVVFLGAIGFVGATNMNAIFQGIEEMYNERLLPVKWLNSARTHNRAMEAFTYRLMLIDLNDVEERDRLTKQIEDRTAQFNKLIADFKTSEIDEYEQRRLKMIEAIAPAYQDARNQAIELALDGQQEAAFLIYINSAERPLNDMNTALIELSDYNSLMADEMSASLRADFTKALRTMVIIIVAAIVVLSAFGLWIALLVVKPVRKIQGLMSVAATGNLRVEAESDSRDEIGQLTRSFRDMLASFRTVLRQVADTTEQVAASSEQLTASAEQTAQASQMISTVAQELSVGSERQVEDITSVLQSADSIAATAEQMTSNSKHMQETAIIASQKSQEGLDSMKTLREKMNELQSSIGDLSGVIRDLGRKSETIEEVMKLISDIAAQTNLLALNAAIEASRAGEQGRGFAVVAAEVRKLAEQSTKSAKDVADQVAQIRESIGKAEKSMSVATVRLGEGVHVVNESREVFEAIGQTASQVEAEASEVNISIEDVTCQLESIFHALQAVSQVAQEAAAGTQNVSAATEEQLASMEEMTASSNHLSSMAQELQEQVNRFKA